MSAIHCDDCRHYVDSQPGLCTAAELGEVLETPANPADKSACCFCDAVRDMKHACGHAARWFKKKEPT